MIVPFIFKNKTEALFKGQERIGSEKMKKPPKPQHELPGKWDWRFNF
jgi:hypothetical protein